MQTPTLSSGQLVYAPLPESSLHRLAALVVAVIYAIVLASLPVEYFVDRDSYLDYAAGSFAILALNAAGGIGSVLANEPLWLLINGMLSLALDAEDVLRVIIFSSSFGTALIVLRLSGRHFILVLLFLLLPQVLKNNVIHLRQGLAICVFLMGMSISGTKMRWTVLCAAALIHASFFFVIAFILLNSFFNARRWAASLRIAVFFMVGVFLSFTVLWIAAQLGARQGDQYDVGSEAISGFGFIFWSSFMLVILSEGTAYIKRNALAVAVLVFYISSYFFLPVAARIFESAMILILLAGLGLTGWRKRAFFTMFLFYLLLQWFQRFGLPGYGWAAENYV